MAANGSLIIPTSNRMSRMVGRIRVLNELGDALLGRDRFGFLPKRQARMADQFRHLRWRSDRQYAPTMFYLAFGCSVGTSLKLNLDALFGHRLVAVPTLLALAGVSLLIGASIVLVQEARRAMLTNLIEMLFCRDLNARRRADGGCGRPQAESTTA